MSVRFRAIWWEMNYELLQATLKMEPWWTNFRNHYRIKGDHSLWEGDGLDHWGATWIEHGEGSSKACHIEFEKEEDAALFLLRWS